MAKHNETGSNGETIAENFLKTFGYSVLHRNWRHGRSEIDIIASLGGAVIFIEVKTRSSNQFGFPEDFVDVAKRQRMYAAAEAYSEQYALAAPIRFDLISITQHDAAAPEVRHFIDAF
jgi:putative endonuclease